MDAVEALAVEAVIEVQADCADLDRARAALSEALIAARAPAHGGSRPRGARPTSRGPVDHWSVTMTVEPASTKPATGKSVQAVIVDDAGTIVAERTLLDRSARACVPLARAVGAWASLVLDAELARTKDDDGSQPTPPTPSSKPAPAGWGVLAPGASTSGPVPPIELAVAHPARDASSSGDADVATTTPRAFELGAMVYLRNGIMASGGIAGISPFVAIEVANAWLVRPSLAFGRSTPGTQTTNHLGARGDLCRRIPGNYIDRRGIEADICAGIEGGVVTTQTGPSARGANAGRLGVGPSAALRGELGWGVALEVRGLVGANLLLSPLLGDDAQPPLVFASAELGMSVRLP